MFVRTYEQACQILPEIICLLVFSLIGLSQRLRDKLQMDCAENVWMGCSRRRWWWFNEAVFTAKTGLTEAWGWLRSCLKFFYWAALTLCIFLTILFSFFIIHITTAIARHTDFVYNINSFRRDMLIFIENLSIDSKGF